MSPSKRKCYAYMADHRSWAESESHCQGYHGHLAASTSLEELTRFRNICGEASSECWIGGRGTNTTTDANWRWSDNTTSWNATITPKARFKSSCKNISCQNDDKFSCTLTSGTNGSTSLVAEGCNASHAYICMTSIGMQIILYWFICFASHLSL